MHMPTVDQPSGGVGTVSGVRVVAYTATGSEGTSFMVDIGHNLESDYSVVPAPQGVANDWLIDLPTGGGNRTSSQFRVLVAVQPTAGDVYHFWITEV